MIQILTVCPMRTPPHSPAQGSTERNALRLFGFQ